MEPAPVPADKERRRPRRIAWVIGLVTVALAAGGGYYFWTRDKLPLIRKPLTPTYVFSKDNITFYGVAFHPDGTHLVGGRGGADLFVWDLRTGQEVNSHRGMTPDTGDLFDRRRKRQERRRSLQQAGWTIAAPLTSLASANSLPALASACLMPEALEQTPRKVTREGFISDFGIFRVIDTAKGAKVLKFTATESWSEEPEEKGASEEEVTSCFEIGTYTLKPSPPDAAGYFRLGAASRYMEEGTKQIGVVARGFCPEGRWLLLVHRDGRLQRGKIQLDPQWMGCTFRTLSTKIPVGEVRDLALLPGGKRAVIIDGRGAIGVWDLEAGKEINRLQGFQEPWGSISLSRDGRKLLSRHEDNVVALWDVETGKEVQRAKPDKGRVCSLAFSADGPRFLSEAEDGTLYLWDIQARELRRLVHPEKKWIVPTVMALSPDGSKLAVACHQEVRVYDLPR